MVKYVMKYWSTLLCTALCYGCNVKNNEPIDREALVTRHDVSVTGFDSLGTLSVGNGEFAFSVDATGLQTFPEHYESGIPLGTQSQWGWHSFPNQEKYRREEYLKDFDFGRGRKESYAVQVKQPARSKEASDYYRINPHRLHLGMLGFSLLTKEGKVARPEDIIDIHQKLELWKGEITSSFVFDGEKVNVKTFVAPDKDEVVAHVESKLIADGRLGISLRFPYPTGKHSDSGCDWNEDSRHSTKIDTCGDGFVGVSRVLDSTVYYVQLHWNGKASSVKERENTIQIRKTDGANTLDIACLFSSDKRVCGSVDDFALLDSLNISHWKGFWSNGGAVDFAGSKDVRAKELERRVVLSQYLTAIQCAGSVPPQETGLTYNSWFGKYHLEMIWWHGAHFPLWGRSEMIAPMLSWYKSAAVEAQKIAVRQGYRGIRWMKMTDPSAEESPSSVGSLLIWQQPHLIYLAELMYRTQGDTVLNQYKDLVFETAEFMADFVIYEKDKDRYVLNHINGAQETLKPENSHNPPFEVSYWHYGLSVAQMWRERLGMARDKHWDEIISKLPAFRTKDGLYLAAESLPDTYINERYLSDHPMVLAPYGMLPPVDRMVKRDTMLNTFNFIYDNWFWSHTWGWDYPLAAMTAVRLGMPEKAIDLLLMDKQKNTYLSNGHNYQDQRLRLYLPGNGGLLTAVAMMCAGYDGCTEDTPGFPKDGTWNVRWEGLERLP